MGVHLSGAFGERWDHDVHAALQVGRAGEDEHRALAFHGELHPLYWLASAKDAFVRAGLRDPSGRSGTFLGTELDVEIRYALFPFVELNLQYGELFAGVFVEQTGGGTGARVFYFALTVSKP
jgi:hypothetical protein